MKKLLILTLLSVTTIMASAQTKIRLTAGSNSMTATLVDNAATRDLILLLSNGPLTITMNDYGGFEKVGALPKSLPTSNTQITTEPGDIMLYQGNNMVIFYGTNSWSYTRLGKIDGATAANVRQFLNGSTISLTITLTSTADISEINMDKNGHNKVYNLNGNLVTGRPLPPGLYIINGEKELITR